MTNELNLKIGERVRCGTAGALYGEIGTVTRGGLVDRPDFVFIRWEGRVLSSAYRLNDPLLANLQKFAQHCECPLNGDDCCGCGKFECEEPSEKATRHEDERRTA